MPRPPAPASIRVGLREIAAAAGVSVMTVSLALRGNPRISIATRDRIKRLADELGYHPDPELSRLMNHLRTSRTARGKIGVALVDFYPTPDFVENAYNAKLRRGAQRRASELGFSLSPMHAADHHLNLRHLLKVIRARGIEGALLLPSVVPTELDASVNWNGSTMRARLNTNGDVQYGYPKEGYPLFMDSVALLKDATNVEEAYKFLDFVMVPENAAMISAFARYANGIAGSDAFMPEDMKTAPEVAIPEEFAASGTFLPTCTGKSLDYITAIWTELQK